MRKDANFYIEKYNNLVEEAKKEAAEEGGHEEETIMSFESDANAEEVVGYYLSHYPENPLEIWNNNIAGKTMKEQDKAVTEILKELTKKETP